MNHPFLNKSKFALITFNNVYTKLPDAAFQLSDGTWIMPSVPVPDLGIWNEWIGSIRIERLGRANLGFFVEEPSSNPDILDSVHSRLGKHLTLLFYMTHLRRGIEVAEGADLLCGSTVNGVPGIRQMSQLPAFFQSKGWTPAAITPAWLEDALLMRAGLEEVDADRTLFRRIIRGLNTLFKGLKETGQDRIHQFVRSLEALILPEIGRTEKQFVHRCQTFARAGDDTRTLLQEAFAMRSDTEHLNRWDEAVQNYPANEREDVCWQRTRQMQHLASDAYARLLRNRRLWPHFRTKAAIAEFWKLPDAQRRAIWGKPLDIALDPMVQEYDQSGRATARKGLG